MPERVGFIGLGNMGGRIARRIVDGGSRGRSGFDLDAAARAAAAGVGRRLARREPRGRRDVVLLSLPDSRVVERGRARRRRRPGAGRPARSSST